MQSGDEFHALSQGDQFMEKNNLEEALACYDAAIANGCDTAHGYSGRALALQALSFHYDAIADFSRAISLSPEDCSLYYSRALSKGFVLDFEGEVADLHKAIELCLKKDDLNRAYKNKAKENAFFRLHSGDLTAFFKSALSNAELSLEMDLKGRQRIENASNPEEKAHWKESYDRQRSTLLAHVKMRR